MAELSRIPAVFAIGSPHGDDRLGWELTRHLAGWLPPGVSVFDMSHPMDLIHHTSGYSALVIVDACYGAGPPGSMHRFEWPDSRFENLGVTSSHGFGLVQCLELAKNLGQLPTRVVIFAVEVEAVGPNRAMSSSIAAAIPKLAMAVLREVKSLLSTADSSRPPAHREDAVKRSPKSDANILRPLAFFASATDGELQFLASMARVIHHDAGAVLFREGDRIADIFIVSDGTMSIEILGSDRRLKRIQTVGVGELLGWSPVLGASPITATSRALTSVNLIAFDAVELLRYCDSQPHFGYLFMRRVATAIASRLNATRLQLLDVYRTEVADTGGLP